MQEKSSSPTESDSRPDRPAKGPYTEEQAELLRRGTMDETHEAFPEFIARLKARLKDPMNCKSRFRLAPELILEMDEKRRQDPGKSPIMLGQTLAYFEREGADCDCEIILQLGPEDPPPPRKRKPKPQRAG